MRNIKVEYSKTSDHWSTPPELLVFKDATKFLEWMEQESQKFSLIVEYVALKPESYRASYARDSDTEWTVELYDDYRE